MLKNVIVLPDGTEISTGTNAVVSATYKSYANGDTELAPGSVCASMLDLKFFSPGGDLEVEHGAEVEYYKESDDGTRTKIGLFTLEKPTKPSANTYKFTAYDRVSWLDKDLSGWLSGLEGWPYTLYSLAQMVCLECGLTLVNDSIPNGSFPVHRFRRGEVTGRKLMSWIGQLAARFVRATPDGKIEFAWYRPTEITLEPSRYTSLTYEGYQVAKIDAVQLRLADSDFGLLWPAVDDGANAYIISGNALITTITDDILPYLQTIQEELADVTYTPCKVKLPASLDIQVGDIIQVTDRNGFNKTMYVMVKTQKGQIETLECTGSPRQDSSMVKNNPSVKDLKDYADATASAAVKRQTQLDIFNKLTNNGQIQGLFLEENGQLYINAEYIVTGILSSKDGETFYLDLDNGIFEMRGSGQFLSVDGNSYVTVEDGEIVLYARDGETENFLPKIRQGFNSDANGIDYPYVLLGNAENGKMGLFKKFYNGLWIGDSVPLHDTGAFDPANGAAGFFIDTDTGTPYTVSDGVMRDITVAVFG